MVETDPRWRVSQNLMVRSSAPLIKMLVVIFSTYQTRPSCSLYSLRTAGTAESISRILPPKREASITWGSAITDPFEQGVEQGGFLKDEIIRSINLAKALSVERKPKVEYWQKLKKPTLSQGRLKLF